MRRGVRALALVAAGVIALAAGGCGAPKVGDGTIGSDWAAFGEPTVAKPDSGVCRNGDDDTVDWDIPVLHTSSIACTGSHLAETYHVGTLKKGVDESSPPDVGDPAFREAYEACAAAAKDFLGEDFHRAKVSIVPVMPTDKQWKAKSRFYRCEMFEVKDAGETIVPRTGSLKDGLRAKKPLAIACANDKGPDDNTVNAIDFVSCSSAHTVEFSGVYTAPDKAYPGDKAEDDQALDQCERMAASYLGLTMSAWDRRTGVAWLYWGGGETIWSVGDRTYRCYVGSLDRKKPIKAGATIRNLGSKPLPT
jgi:hypothetical protein